MLVPVCVVVYKEREKEQQPKAPVRTGAMKYTGMSVPVRAGVKKYTGMSEPARARVEK